MGQESAAHLLTALWQEGFKLGFFSHPSVSSFPASPCYSLSQPTASAQGSTKLRGAWKQGSLPAVLIACLHTQPCFTPSRTSGVGMFALHLAFAHGAFFSKIQRELDISGEGKLTLHLIFKLQHLK